MQEALEEQGLEEQAMAWVHRMNSGLTSAEKQQLVAWINQNEQHHRAFADQAKQLNNADSIKELSGIFPVVEQSTFLRKSNRFRPIIISALSVLFVIACVITLRNSLLIESLNTNESLRYQTLIGEQSKVSLPDGSEISLNTDTIIEVSYSDDRRLIELIKGEAMFDVAKDKNRPFVVLSGEKSFTALGTIFNIEQSNAQDMELIVTEGRVLIGERQKVVNGDFLPINTERLLVDQSAVVTAGKKSVILNSIQLSNNAASRLELEMDLAWQAGALIFNHEPLLHVLEEVSRYSHTQFEVSDPKLLSMSVSGYFKIDDVDGLLMNLKNNLAIDYRHTSVHSIELTKQESL
ncbi:FecR family protein [Thalassotalea fusca]